MTAPPTHLPVDDRAVIWSLPEPERQQALADRPLLVMLHGFGSNERDLAGLFQALGPQYLMASLRAPLPLPGMSGSYAWFPLDPERLAAPDAALADAATRGVLRWLEHTHAQVRSAGPVGLLGFSQGAAMCLQMLRHQPEAFACAALLSGFVVPGPHGGDEALAQVRPPVFTGVDPADPIIPPAARERLEAFAREHTTLSARTYPGVGHGISSAGLHDVVSFLEEHLPRI
ncbi:alpha/beta hydrolase [Pseudactinotalea sp. Z1732]|uniref:alpha/beta hydrolase n=1 Tax=Pseudactinotalea sp. Z1732 TaxID=3413026 RepID=UPI003C7B2430